MSAAKSECRRAAESIANRGHLRAGYSPACLKWRWSPDSDTLSWNQSAILSGDNQWMNNTKVFYDKMAGRLWSVDRFGSAVRVVWHFRWRRSIGRPRNPSGSTGGYRSGTPRPGNRQTMDTGRPKTGKRRWTIRWRIQPIANGCIRWNDSILFCEWENERWIDSI